MPVVLAIAVSLHVLTAVFWAGTTFALARGGGPFETLFRPQIGSATVVTLTGAFLWSQLHRAGFGHPEQVLGFGVACALVAAGIQGAGIGSALYALRRGGPESSQAAARMLRAQRIAAGLLAVTVICMVAQRYV